MDEEDKDKVLTLHKKDESEEILDVASNIRETAINLVLVWLEMIPAHRKRSFSHCDMSFLKNFISIVLTYLSEHPGDYKGARELLGCESWPLTEQDED